jgi:uridine kinase
MRGRVEFSLSTWQGVWPPVVNPGRSAVVAHVGDRIRALGDRRVRVAIDGATAAGKTTLGNELAQWLSDAGRVVLRASLDDFKRPRAEAHLYDRVSGEGYYRNAFRTSSGAEPRNRFTRCGGVGLRCDGGGAGRRARRG